MTDAEGGHKRLTDEKIDIRRKNDILESEEFCLEGMNMRYGFGVDLGGTTVKIACFDENGNMLHKWEIPTMTENEGSQILPDIAASILKYMEENDLQPAQIIGIGIGVPGAVNGKGEVNKCINLG